MYRLLRSLLFLWSPEQAHYLAMGMLKFACRCGLGNIIKKIYTTQHDEEIEFVGLKFSNRVGLAAGFDKNARWIDELSLLGFSHIEVGTVTPKPQSGNPKPRLFRLKADEALINRMGFNNDGVDAMVERLKQRKSKIIVGGNIGKNKDTPNERAHEDYIYCFEKLYKYVDYFTVNVSSPNTPGLRALQDKEPLQKLLALLVDLREKYIKMGEARKPILLKIAPDLENTQLDEIIEIVFATKIDGVVATNTTVARSGLKSSEALINEAGGLSGKPVEAAATRVVDYIHHQANGKIPMIAAGGIFDYAGGTEKIQAGATLLQVYTGFIYIGPGIVKHILTK
jgi:dihydroorotate dehydrogenase